jgi:arylmalonate decarboxylase
MPNKMGDHVVGLVVPESADAVPTEAAAMYPDITFIARGIGLQSLTLEGYDEAIDRLVPAAKCLTRNGARAIMVVGTSLTFYRGTAFNHAVTERLSTSTGLPAATMSGALVDGLTEVGARRLAVVTAYSDAVNGLLSAFLRDSGFEIRALRSVRIAHRVGEAQQISEQDILDVSAATFNEAGDADGLLIVCGGLRTLDVTPRIEARCGVPVVSSMPAALRKVVLLAGADANLARGFGRLLSGDQQRAAL